MKHPFDDREVARAPCCAEHDVIALDVEELSALGLGALDAPVAQITGVTIDSRRCPPGDLFVAVGRGTSSPDARAQGAATLVPDEFAALAAIGHGRAGPQRASVVGITGSTGKTTTKDILAALCSPHLRTIASEANYNNELGVPLTLCRIEPDTELCIVEMGMRGPGQIAEACKIVRPDVGIVTAVGPVHLELVGTVERVAQAKASSSPRSRAGRRRGRAGRPRARRCLAGEREAPPVRRGQHPRLRWRRRRCPGDDRRRRDAGCPRRPFHSAPPRPEPRCGAPRLRRARAPARPRAGESGPDDLLPLARGEDPLADGGLLINDAYNANPMSMRAALEHLSARAGDRRPLAVLGTMAELGPDAPRYHEEISALAAELGLAALLAVGEEARGYIDGTDGRVETLWAPDAASATELLAQLRRPGDAILVKASSRPVEGRPAWRISRNAWFASS